jgi:hypothetical protein
MVARGQRPYEGKSETALVTGVFDRPRARGELGSPQGLAEGEGAELLAQGNDSASLF